MSGWSRHLVISTGLVLAMTAPALAQGVAPAGGGKSRDWKFTIYPILAWVPTDMAIDVTVPGDSGGSGGGSGGGVEHGAIVDSRFDGAFLGGFSATNGVWRIDADGLWAAVGGDRPNSPNLTVDLDIIYGHGALGRQIYKDMFVTAGFRRLALKYDITIAQLPRFERKPGLWDPVVGVAYHHVGGAFEAHGVLDVGGFGVGSDQEVAASFRIDWKPIPHVGLTGGYSFLRFKFADEVAGKQFEATQRFAGPVVGLGIYF
jgi:hypothetical protein